LPVGGEEGCVGLASFDRAVVILSHDSSLSCLPKNCLRGNTPRHGPTVKTVISNYIPGSIFLMDQSGSYCLGSYLIPFYEDFYFLDKGKGSVCQRGRIVVATKLKMIMSAHA